MRRPNLPDFIQSRAEAFGYGFSAASVPYRPMTRPDRHNEIELNLVEGGELTYLFGGRAETLREGRFMAFWGAVPHQVIHAREVRRLHWVHLPLAWVLQWGLPNGFLDALMGGRIVLEADPARAAADLALMRQWVEEITGADRRKDPIALLEIEARLHRLALTAPPAGPRRNPRPTPAGSDKAQVMARHMAEHYTGPLRVEQVADAAGLNPEYAMTLFKRTFGLPMTHYINQHRVWHAQRLLATTGDKILSIAIDSGFGSLSQFNAVFKAVSGRTPRNFRASVQGRERKG